MADTKTTALTALTTPIESDIIYIVDNPGGTPLSRKITLANLRKLIDSEAITFGTGTDATIQFDATNLVINTAGALSITGADVEIANGQGLVVGHTAQITAPATAELQVLGTAGNDSTAIVARFSANTGGAALRGVKSRAASIGAGGTIVQDNDEVFAIIAHADDGTDLNSSIGSLEFLVDDSSPAANQVGGEILLRTTTTGGTLTTAATWSRTQRMTTASHVDVGSATTDGPALLAETASDTNPTLTANQLQAIALGFPLIGLQGRTAAASNTAIVFDAPDFTLSDGATAQYTQILGHEVTVTLAGTTQVTTLNVGMGLSVAAITLNQSGGAVTVNQASTLHVPVITAGSSVTANRMISTGVADCYLTVGGVWTDTSSTQKVKRNIQEIEDMGAAISKLKPKQYNYNGHFDNDYDRDRFGVVAEEMPDFLKVPGEENPSGVSGVVMANFALASVSYLHNEIKQLKSELKAMRGRK
jgi:hypothetical protein